MEQNQKKKRIVKISFINDNDPTIHKNTEDIADPPLADVISSKRKIDDVEEEKVRNDDKTSSECEIKKEEMPGPSKKLKTFQNTNEKGDKEDTSLIKEENNEYIVEVKNDNGTTKKVTVRNSKNKRMALEYDKYIIKDCPDRNIYLRKNKKAKKAIKVETNIKETYKKDISDTDKGNLNLENNSSSDVETSNPDIRKRSQNERMITKRKQGTKKPKCQYTEKEQTDDANQIQITIETNVPTPRNSEEKSNHKTDALMKFFKEQRLTYRLMKRANFIIKMVRRDKVIVDTVTLVKALREEELKEGNKVIIDKKSLLRLILKLSEFGLLKFRKATLKSDTVEKCVCFICDVNIDDEHSVITSALEQYKMKFFIMSSKNRNDDSNVIEEKDIPNKAKNIVEPFEFPEKIVNLGTTDKSVIKYKYNRNIGKQYGLRPKFVRCRIIHELLYYLIYEQFQAPVTDQVEIEKLFEDYGGIEKIFENDFCTIYNRELSWKMFIPPLPVHRDWPKGWAFISDIVVRLPLYIFVKCFNVPFELPNIEEYLSHPVRRYFLVKNLPPIIRNGLIHGRKFLFSITESLKSLCFIGLIQFGPQKLKEKDQVFVYLNTKTSLLNTVTSRPGYIKISEDIEYDKIDYKFENFHDVEQYWYDLWSICINTALGNRSSVTGEFVVLENPLGKPELVASLKPRTADQAEKNDTADIPGDRKGAAGLDSSLFAHLKRNWNWPNIIPYLNDNKPEEEGKINKQELIFKEKLSIEDGNESTWEEKSEIKIKKEISKQKPKKFKIKKVISKRKDKIIRQVLPKKFSNTKKCWYDEKDQQCLKKMSKLRTEWTPIEDHVVLLCAITAIYLCPNHRKQAVEYTVMRDILHKMVAFSNNKTSRAVQRRKNYVMKNIKTRKSVLMCLEEIRQCEYVNEKFGSLVKEYQNTIIPTVTLNIAFVEMVDYLNLKFGNQIPKHHVTRIELPDTIEEVKEKYVFNVNSKKTSSKYKDVETIYDINSDVVRSVIHSSLCSSKDKTSYAFQLFKIYQQYPEALLRQVITKIRLDKLASMKKSGILKARNCPTGCILQSPFKLSISYINKLQNTKFTFKSLLEANGFLQNVKQWMQTLQSSDNNNYDITFSDHGTSLIIADAMVKFNLEFIFEHPDQVIILDPILKHDKTYERIVKKYYDILNAQNNLLNYEENKNSNNNSDSEDDNFPHIDDQFNNLANKNHSTRIAFHMMKADMFDGNDKNKQHMHDYFVVQASKVYLEPPKNNIIQTFETESKKLTEKVLNQIKNDAIVSDSCGKIMSDEIKLQLPNLDLTVSDFEYIEKIKCYIWNAKELGRTIKELKNITPDTVNLQRVVISLNEVINILRRLNIILRVGITVIRLVHFDFKKPWLVQTDKIMRLEKEKMPKTLPVSKTKWKGKYVVKNEKKEDNEKTKIKVIISPWIRLDGSINKRVLDRWMGTFISLCIEEAGIKLQELILRMDLLKPTETINLIEILTTIGCVKLVKINKPKVSLFSKEENYDFENACMLDDPKDIFIEPTEDAIFNFSIFIGAKTYNTNFID